MKIDILELKGYIRFMLNNTSYIRYTPQEVVQLILGSNGSGKSSLLEQLTPLPAIPQDFEKGGYKKIVVRHRGSHYELNNYFNTPMHHEFIKDGVDLNRSRTITEQRELVKKEFGLTPDIHNLLMGQTVFHAMGPTERRKWFTLMSSTNYNYAMNIYGQLKEKLRDIQGGIKLAQSRYIQESSKLLTQEQELQLKEEVLALRDLLKVLYDHKPVVNSFESDIQESIQAIESSLNDTAISYMKEQISYTNYEGFSSLDGIDDYILKTRTHITLLEQKSQCINNALSDTQSKYDLLSKTALSETHDVYDRIQILENTLTQSKKSIIDPLAFLFEDPALAYQALNTIYPTLSETLTLLVPNPDKYYCRNTLEKESKKITALTNQIESLQKEHDHLLGQKKEHEYHKNHDKTECPKCRHTWSKGYDESVLSKLNSSINKVIERIQQATVNKTSSEELVTAIKEYFVLYKVYADIVKNWTILNPLWTHLDGQQSVFKDPRNVLTFIEKIKNDVQSAIQLKQYESQLKDLYDVKSIIESDDKSNLEKLEQELKDYTHEYHQIHQSLIRHKSQLKQYERYKASFKKLDGYTQELESLKKQREDKYKELILLTKRSILNNLIHTVQSELSKKEKQLSEINLQAAIIENLKADIEKMEERQEVLKVMTRRLSPTDGLIAKGLLGFINAFVEQMNSFIRKVWSTPMQIVPTLPESADDIDLDYKFTVNINKQRQIPDVNKCSIGMREIIDLAFRLVAMKYLDVLDFPLVLDEFAKALDSAHRKTAFHVISGLIAYSHFPQIFIVSHFYDCYGSLRNADISVLCGNNIDLPVNTVFNQQFIIR